MSKTKQCLGSLAMVTVVAMSSLAGNAMAQYTGPSNAYAMNVKQLLETGKDDQHVILRGFITSHTGGEHYIFRDETGEMRVEIDAKFFQNLPAIDAKTKVQISGEFDKHLMKEPELDVKQLSIAQ